MLQLRLNKIDEVSELRVNRHYRYPRPEVLYKLRPTGYGGYTKAYFEAARNPES